MPAKPLTYWRGVYLCFFWARRLGKALVERRWEDVAAYASTLAIWARSTAEVQSADKRAA